MKINDLDTMNDKELEDVLPQSVRDLIELLGFAPTFKLVEHFGGTELRVPHKFDPGHLITRIVGHEASARFVQNYAGEVLYIPKPDTVMRAQRNRKIKAKHEAGASAVSLAHEFNLSYRHIWNILGADDSAPPAQEQGRLF